MVGPGKLLSFANTSICVAHHLKDLHFEYAFLFAFCVNLRVGKALLLGTSASALKWTLHIDLNRRTCLHMPHALPTYRASNHSRPIYPETYLHHASATSTHTAETDSDLHSGTTTNSLLEAHRLPSHYNHSTTSSSTPCPVLAGNNIQGLMMIISRMRL